MTEAVQVTRLPSGLTVVSEQMDRVETVSFGAYVAACLAAGQAYMLARVRDHRLEPVALNAWTLAQRTDRLAEVADVDPGQPAVALDHVLAGAGAVDDLVLRGVTEL